jgi:phosphatidylglycerol---prolipoprotein diacylglyceryl transferase
VFPVVWQFGAVTIYTYGVLAAVGFLLGLRWAYCHAAPADLNPRRIWNLGIYGILVAVLSSKLWLLLTDWNYFAANPRDIFSITTFESAGTFYGGVLGGLLWIALYTHFQKMPFLGALDLIAAPLALGHAVGRLGCFAAGCFGKPTSLPWGVTFTSPVAGEIAGTPLGIRLHPTQLYESAAEFLNLLVLARLATRRRFAGHAIGAYLILYGIERGAIEFLRDDPGRTLMFDDRVSLMQLVSIGLVLIGGILWWRGLRGFSALPPDAPPTPSSAPSA